MTRDTYIIITFTSLLFSLVSCASPNISTEKRGREEIIVYYSPPHVQGVRTVIPVTEERIIAYKQKKITSQKLYMEINSILSSSCSGNVPEDNMMILAKIYAGRIAIHQDGAITVNNKICNTVSVQKVHDIVRLMDIRVKWIRKLKNKGQPYAHKQKPTVYHLRKLLKNHR